MTKMPQAGKPAGFIGSESFPYSDAFMGHAMRPENVGLMETPDGCGALADTSGYKMEIHLRIVNGRSEEAEVFGAP
ncbi:MAG: hypothetical protein HY788_07305 [Deltaproteobacteria bacterium]|nr:hypothetical protein [Deltaproteobacteria bacterium]